MHNDFCLLGEEGEMNRLMTHGRERREQLAQMRSSKMRPEKKRWDQRGIAKGHCPFFRDQVGLYNMELRMDEAKSQGGEVERALREDWGGLGCAFHCHWLCDLEQIA